MSRFEEFLRDEHGAAAAEMALMVPLLLILMFSGFEAGHYFYTEHQVIKAVREGSRYAGRLGFANFPCGGSADPTAVANIQQVTRTGTVTGTEPRVSGLALSDITVTHRCDANFTDSGIFKGTTGGAPIVLVRAETGYNSLLGAMGLMDTSAVVQASSEAVVNGI
ncbi:pilus assembly protein [Qipengyuania xiapuensis]|uniref:Pilus assembly protein n=1 Tax=Qipengyuania xiapuensis TaxID=2867236 RepID=A0ABX8ZS27_9SPHN|nr:MULTISPECIES: TadE/TadG family type IV pilus assembly protein [Qipengyuania]MBX7533721.1 pilus assembly protein [Qipengyuania xiamenensis]QZD91821.1 pilus assembly protein [Qipengyuania xiapuensis]